MYWGNEGQFTIHEPYLRGISYIMDFWNERDRAWISRTASQWLDEPTSDPVTFDGVSLIYHFGKKQTNLYWGKRFRLIGTIVVYSGQPGGQIKVKDFETRVEGCFTRNDPHYFDKYGCTPPHQPCP